MLGGAEAEDTMKFQSEIVEGFGLVYPTSPTEIDGMTNAGIFHREATAVFAMIKEPGRGVWFLENPRPGFSQGDSTTPTDVRSSKPRSESQSRQVHASVSSLRGSAARPSSSSASSRASSDFQIPELRNVYILRSISCRDS